MSATRRRDGTHWRGREMLWPRRREDGCFNFSVLLLLRLDRKFGEQFLPDRASTKVSIAKVDPIRTRLIGQTLYEIGFSIDQ